MADSESELVMTIFGRTMRNLKLLLMGTLLLGIAGIFSMRTNAQSGVVFKARPLIDASIEEIQQAALDYTYTRFKVLSEAPTILLVRQVNKDELPSLGLSAIGFAGEEPPLMLVAMRGDFDVSNIRGRSLPFRATHIVYVFDLKVGAPTLIEGSVDGSHLRKLLNDPSLPEPPASDLPIGPEPVREPMTPAPKLPYGSVAPPVVPSSATP